MKLVTKNRKDKKTHFQTKIRTGQGEYLFNRIRGRKGKDLETWPSQIPKKV